MCRVFEENWSLGKAEGRAEGIIEIAVDCGLSEDEIITRLQTKLTIPRQKAQEYFAKFAKQTV